MTPTPLPAPEPAAGPWRTAPLADLIAVVERAAGAPTGRPRILAVDGAGGSGKSTLAAALRAAVPASAVVSTDDVAWHHSFFGWADLLADGVLAPARRGEAVSCRPPAWDARGRDGSIEVPAGLDLVVVEGTGAGRVELAHLVDAVLWVGSDADEARRRCLGRDVEQGVNGDAEQAERFWDEWQEEERPFLAEQRPWERACAVVAGTAPTPPPGHVVFALPLGAAR